MRLTCPNCPDVPLRDGARYCANCGLEARQECPGCGNEFVEHEHRYLAAIDPKQSVWCENRGVALYACNVCGRWLTPDVGACPDPHCGGRVLPTQPQHTGRRWDGRGGGAGFVWPARWSEKAHEHHAPQTATWSGMGTVHAAIVAHGRLSLWAGSQLITLELPQEGSAAALPLAWQNPLGSAGRPKPGLPFAERVSVIGSAAVLSTEGDFHLAGLHRQQGSEPLNLGVPLAQTGSMDGWAGWSEQNREIVLHLAAPAPAWNVLHPMRAETPPEAQLAPGGRLVARDGVVYWPGIDSAVWKCDFKSGCVTRAVPPHPGLVSLWAARDGIGVVYEAPDSNAIRFGLSAGDAKPPTSLTQAGRGPLRGAFAEGDFVVLSAGPELIAFQSEESHSPTHQPVGEVVASAMIPSEKGFPRLLALVLDKGITRLLMIEPTTGRSERLWTENSITPLGLLPVGADVFVIHDRGVVRLREAAH